MKEIKKKRVVTRIGDIFCIEFDEYKVYLQFIAVDMSQLNSTTIRVFKTKYPLNFEFNAETIVKDEVDFYAHTFLQPGLKAGVWTKVGKNKDIGDLEHILFRNAGDWPMNKGKSYDWWICGINKEYIKIGELTEEYRSKSYEGIVVPPIDIIEKIKTGKFRGNRPL